MPQSSLTSFEARSCERTLPPGSHSLRLHAGLSGALLCGLALVWWCGGGWVFPLDDAYITLHNAAVLRDGIDANYGVPALIGATSLVHLALVAAVSAFLPPVPASYLVSCAGVLLFAVGLLTLALRHGVPRADACVLVALGLATGAPHLLNGLETGLVLAAVTWILVLAARDDASPWVPAACGILPFLRPELGLLAVILLIRRAVAAPDRRMALRDGLRDVGIAGLAALPWLLWFWITTGAIVPNTMAAKLAFFAQPRQTLAVALLISVGSVLGALGPAAAAVVLCKRGLTGFGLLAPVLWAFMGLFILGFALAAPEVLQHNDHRYATTLIPVAAAAMCFVVRAHGLPMLRLLLGLQCGFCVLSLPQTLASLSAGQAAVRDHAEVAAWAQEHLPADARILVHDAGVIAYATDRPLTDLVGLKSPDSVAAHHRWTAPSHGADRATAIDAIARRSGATHAIILDDRPLAFWTGIADDLRHTGWRLDMLYATERLAGYRLYRLSRP